jgi:hypothetical protein
MVQEVRGKPEKFWIVGFEDGIAAWKSRRHYPIDVCTRWIAEWHRRAGVESEVLSVENLN